MPQRPQPATDESAQGGDRLFWALLLASLALRCAVAVKGHSLRHPDEVFQTIEQSHRLVFGFGIVPWEYVEGIRWIGTPLFLTPPLWLARWLDKGPEIYVPLTGMILAALSLLPVWLLYRMLRPTYGPRVAAMACLLPLFWYENLDFASSTLSDAIGATLLGCAAVAVHWLGKTASWRLIALVAALLALTFATRFHLSPALALLGLVALVQLSSRGRLTLIVALLICAVALATLDMAFGMYPFQHVWLNIYRNIVDGVAETFGVEPMTFYLTQLWQRTGIAGLLLLAVLIATIRLHWRLSVPAVLLLAAFSFVAHKEYRFYYPATLLLTLAAGWGLAELSQGIRRLPARPVVSMSAATAVILLVTLPSFVTLVQERTDNSFLAGQAAALDPAVCGMAVSGYSFWTTGGHTHFHRDVPLEWISADRLKGGESQRINVVMAVPEHGAALSPVYSSHRCWHEGLSQPMCLFVRPGGCS